MSSLGVTKLLGQKFVAESADAKRIDQAQANSVLSIISMELESALQQAYNFAALYLGRKPPKITLDRDFDFYRLLGQDIAVIGDLNRDGLITDKSFLQILKSGEILPDTVDLNKELRETAKLKEAKKNELLDAQATVRKRGSPNSGSTGWSARQRKPQPRHAQRRLAPSAKPSAHQLKLRTNPRWHPSPPPQLLKAA